MGFLSILLSVCLECPFHLLALYLFNPDARQVLCEHVEAHW